MQCRWENFGIEHRPTASEFGLAVPATTSLEQFMSLAECTGPKGFTRLCLDAVNVLHGATTLLFDDWKLILQPDASARRSGGGIDLDVTWLHRLTKAESVPDYIVKDSEGVSMTLVSFSGPLPQDLRRIAEGLEIGKAEAAMEIGLNLRNLQLVTQSHGGRLVFERESEYLELRLPE